LTAARTGVTMTARTEWFEMGGHLNPERVVTVDPGSSDFDVIGYGPAMFYLGGELDLAAAARFRDAITGPVSAGGLITIDVSGLRFIDGAGIRVIREALDEMPSGCIVVHGASHTFLRLADVVGMTDAPRLHLQACGEDPFPGAIVIPAPVADLEVRFQRLRDSFIALGSQTRASWERSREVLDRTHAVRSILAERRAA